VDLERAVTLYQQGHTVRQIAVELGMSYGRVAVHLRRAGVEMRAGPPSADVSTEEIIRLREQGLTWPEIGARVGMSAPGVASRVRRATLKGTGWVNGAVVYGQAPAGATCVRCDEAIRAGDQAASVPGLNARGWTHVHCWRRDRSARTERATWARSPGRGPLALSVS